MDAIAFDLAIRTRRLPDILRLEASRMMWRGKMAEFAGQKQEENMLRAGPIHYRTMTGLKSRRRWLAQRLSLAHKKA
jgi:hypothetical protein